ncbi:hypothetical protein NLI96_g662 [Meripilus lineatus]|uniref:Uncharacterized protein n=1 Tax=Meripilus lineatus TaxID=2056292 RepID=A0AAD5YJ31_9APHY|nr:hypothetical protein NLI96_g662 [Physisporinus lineatus]
MVAKGKQVENEGDAHTFEAKHRLLDGHRRMQYGLSVAGKLMRLCYSGILREYGGNRTTRTARDEANTEEGVQVPLPNQPWVYNVGMQGRCARVGHSEAIQDALPMVEYEGENPKPPQPHATTRRGLSAKEYMETLKHWPGREYKIHASYLKSSLTQAKAERLLGTDILSSAEADLMITGPALCLYFAALRSTTDPPSVPLPRLSKATTAPTDLSLANCPEVFRPFLIIWSQSVPAIQSLPPEHQHDLARVICNLSPLSNPPNLRLNGIAADLRAVAIEISMRRTFQDRYAHDLQAAIDAGNSNSLQIKASFVPPPIYQDQNPPSSPLSTPPPLPNRPRSPRPPPKSPQIQNPDNDNEYQGTSTKYLNPIPPEDPYTPTPTFFTPNAPAIEFIRETLYAALADVLEQKPTIRRLLRSNPPRAYFAAVAFAILDVATYSTTHTYNENPSIRGVLGKQLFLSECPAELRPFMKELCDIGKQARDMTEEDSLASVQAMQQGKDLPAPRLDRARDILEGGVGYAYNETVNGAHRRQRSRGEETRFELDSATMDPRRRTTSTENRAVAFANRINALALGMTKLRAFKERQEIVFKVLIGVVG